MCRQFELYSDRIRVVGTGLGRFDETVSLAILRPLPNWQWVHGLAFRLGAWMLACSVLWAVIEEHVSRDEAIFLLGVLSGPLALALVGLTLLVMNARPVEFARFPTDDGWIALDVG